MNKPFIVGKCNICAGNLPAGVHKSTRYCTTCRPPYVNKTPAFFNKKGQRICEQCRDAVLDGHHSLTRFCSACTRKRNIESSIRSGERRRSMSQAEGAWRITRMAIKYGFLPEPKTLLCVDCGDDALCYDHREYAQPLKVEPVCRGCNNTRGPAIDAMPSRRRQIAEEQRTSA